MNLMAQPVPLEPVAAAEFFCAAALDGLLVPRRQWLVPDLVPGRTVTLLSGDGGTGKSLLALQLACAVALGRPWIGRDVATGGAVYISAEDDRDELHRRLAAVAEAENFDLADLDRLHMSSLAGQDALLATLDPGGRLAPSPLFREVEAQVEDLGPALVVLDTLADLFPGNENDRAQARQFVGLVRGLAIRHECAIVLLSHPSVAGMASGTGLSGSTAWNGSVRSRLYLDRVKDAGNFEPDPDARVLKTMKANYGPTGGEIALRWEAGRFVAQSQPEAETGLDRQAATSKAERVFLGLLRAYNETGQRVNAAGGALYAPLAFSRDPKAEGVTRRAFAGAMQNLLRDGRIENVESGPPSRRRSHLVEVSP